MPALLSAENRIQSRLQRLNCTAGFLSQLAQIPASRLSESFRGIKALSDDDAKLLERLLNELDSLVAAFEPIPIQLTNPQQIRALLEDVRDRRLTEAFCVRFGDRSWFCEHRNGKMLSTFCMLQGAAMTRLVAEKVAAGLRTDYPDEEIAVLRNPFSSPDSIVDSFDEIWQPEPKRNKTEAPMHEDSRIHWPIDSRTAGPPQDSRTAGAPLDCRQPDRLSAFQRIYRKIVKLLGIK